MSDKPLAERLQVKGSRRLAVLHAPPALEGFAAAPRAPLEAADVVLLFAATRAKLETSLPPVLEAARKDAIVWIGYPKLTSKQAGDLNRDIIRKAALGFGLDTVSQVAVDADWSALRMKRVN